MLYLSFEQGDKYVNEILGSFRFVLGIGKNIDSTGKTR